MFKCAINGASGMVSLLSSKLNSAREDFWGRVAPILYRNQRRETLRGFIQKWRDQTILEENNLVLKAQEALDLFAQKLLASPIKEGEKTASFYTRKEMVHYALCDLQKLEFGLVDLQRRVEGCRLCLRVMEKYLDEAHDFEKKVWPF